jgi:hypothetical protein
MKTPLQRLYQTKLALLATISTVVGFALMAISYWMTSQRWIFVGDLTNGVGATLFGIGLLGVFFQYIGAADQETQDDERVRRMLKQEAPNFVDAVVEGFAFAPQSLSRVASPETLDQIIKNCLAIRLGDRELAADAYSDLREQVLRSAVCWHDAHVSITLSPWTEGPKSGRGSMYVATIKWEYRFTPDNAVMRFSCVSDQDEYRELLQDPTSTAAWYFEPIAGLSGASPEVFQPIQIAIDGEPRKPRRTARSTSQTFTVTLEQEAVTERREIAVSYTQRLLLQQNGHLLHLDLSHPVKGLNVEFSYGNCGIRHVNVLDYIAGPSQAHITQLPASDLTPSIAVSYDGWIFPKGGVAFVWVLESELTSRGKSKSTI